MRLLTFILITLLASSAFAQVHVDGYYRKDGTYVGPHWRSSPDGDKSNNWSTDGNYNPYTGKEGDKKYDSYDNYGGGTLGGGQGSQYLGN